MLIPVQSYAFQTNDRPGYGYCPVHYYLGDDAGMHLAANLDYRIKNRRPEITLNGAATQAGVSQSVLYRVVHDATYQPKRENLEKLAHFFLTVNAHMNKKLLTSYARVTNITVLTQQTTAESEAEIFSQGNTAPLLRKCMTPKANRVGTQQDADPIG